MELDKLKMIKKTFQEFKIELEHLQAFSRGKFIYYLNYRCFTPYSSEILFDEQDGYGYQQDLNFRIELILTVGSETYQFNKSLREFSFDEYNLRSELKNGLYTLMRKRTDKEKMEAMRIF